MKNYTLITGASSGIGLELARIAAKEGRNLFLVARDAAKLHSVKDELTDGSTNKLIEVRLLAIDLSKPDSAQKVYEFAQKEQMRVDELINNAGFGDYSLFGESKLTTQLEMITLNISTLTALTHLFLPAMIENNSGKILNLASIAAFLPGPYMSVYYASKHFVLAFSESLAEELRGTGVSVTTLCPGPTKSNFSATAHAEKTSVFKGNIPTSEVVAKYGWAAMQKRKRVVVHGLKNRILVQLTRFIPRKTLSKIVKKIQS